MAIITLTTDFGLEDAYVGIVKGVILTRNPGATIVDVTHCIPPGDVSRASYLIESAYRYFPSGSIHVVVVDPGVGTGRDVIALEADGHFFLAPDNGILSDVLPAIGTGNAVSVQNTRYFLSPLSQTFHGRDVFAPVAAHLSMGHGLGDLGPRVDMKSMVRLDRDAPVAGGPHAIIGSVVTVDRFGNLITNIQEQDLSGIGAGHSARRLKIRIGTQTIDGLSAAYASAEFGKSLAIIGSTGRLEISINGGNAREVLAVGPGAEIRVEADRSFDKR